MLRGIFDYIKTAFISTNYYTYFTFLCKKLQNKNYNANYFIETFVLDKKINEHFRFVTPYV